MLPILWRQRGNELMEEASLVFKDMNEIILPLSLNAIELTVNNSEPTVFLVRANAMLLGDANGDGVADFRIYLNTAPTVVASDFLF